MGKPISRRRFLKSAGAIGIGAALVSPKAALGHGAPHEPVDESADDVVGVVRNAHGNQVDVDLGTNGLVRVPYRHFPSDWVHRQGDFVAVGTDTDGVVVAGPLVARTDYGPLSVSGDSVSIGTSILRTGSPRVLSFARRATALLSGRSFGIGYIAKNISGRQRLFGLLAHQE